MSLRRLVAVLLLFIGLAGMLPRASAEEAPLLAQHAKSAILVDAATGRVLFAKDPDAPRAIASMTKLMTLYLALKAIQAGKARADDLVSVSERAYRTGGSQIWLEPGERLPLRALLLAIAVGSANDASVAVAEHLSGSVENFVAAMNDEAKRLGMRHTHFVNPHGLDAEGHVSTARDLAILARRAIAQPGLLELTSMREDRSLRDGKGGHLWLVNHNRLLGKYAGLDGLKTGYTSEAGYCLVATARRGATRFIAVVMGEPTSRQRFAEARELLDYGFAHYETVRLVSRGERFGPVTVVAGQRRQIWAKAEDDLAVLVAAGEGARVRRQVHLPASVQAPVEAGRPLGIVMAVGADGKTELGRVRLVAEMASPRWTFPGLILEVLRGMLRL